ncbi:MAG: TIGR03086 family protein [Microthrixaceae bacterium]|nr:TIGR03086 family protein [Microthrixaceae bacterium]
MPPHTLAQIQTIASGVLSNVTADQLTNSTPCDAWNVSQLIDHMVGAQHWARAAVEGTEQTETGEGSSNGDFVSTFNEAAAASLAAFSEEGALGRIVNAGMGDMPAAAILGLAMTDTFVHAWDLAAATGQDTNLDPDLAEQILKTARAHTPDAMRSEDGAVFGFEQPAPDGAGPATQLAAFLGRKV